MEVKTNPNSRALTAMQMIKAEIGRQATAEHPSAERGLAMIELATAQDDIRPLMAEVLTFDLKAAVSERMENMRGDALEAELAAALDSYRERNNV